MKRTTKRIWIYWNCWTRITITEGKTFRLSKSEPTDEGFSYEDKAFYLAADGSISFDSAYGGCDCDGRIDHFEKKIWEPGFGYNEHGQPRWQKEDAWQRDHSAEAMGY